MTGRLIAVGDIHGCHHEFSDMLQLLDLKGGDRVVLLGDIVNRGPDSTKVIDLAKASGCVCLLGNHELRLLKFKRTGDRKYMKEHDLETFDALRPEDWAYLESMPLTYQEADLNTVFVHGGSCRASRGRGSRRGRHEDPGRRQGGAPKEAGGRPDAPPWADLWGGPPFVVYGHTPRPEIYKLKWSIGIDTGCVMGGYLTAYILPERRIVQVKARQRYFP